MAKRRSRQNPAPSQPDLFGKPSARRRRTLILPRHLAQRAEDKTLQGKAHDRAYEILMRWADMHQQGHLQKKETALDANFLHEIFGEALGYKTATQSPEAYQQQRNFSIPGVGTADGALGDFSPGATTEPVAVIELKGADADLDHDRFNGRTPVQQCWDYLNALPGCPWGVVSNFVTFRLYHRDKTQLAYEEFHLQDLRKPETFRQFYCLFQIGGLLRSSANQPPRALALLEQTESRRREVGDELYQAYSDNRFRLIDHLRHKHGKTPETAIHIAQKLLDRIIFVAFCEQRGLLRERSIEDSYQAVPPFSKVTNPRWQNFLGLFKATDKEYNGGLFEEDGEVDNLQLDDDWTNFFNTVAKYDFRDEVNVDVLGHIFEKSIGELEHLRTALFGADGDGNGQSGGPSVMPKSAERKRSGIYYTPPDFTRFIVHNTLAVVIDQRMDVLRVAHRLTKQEVEADALSPALAAYWQGCWQAVRDLKVCDPACGSGAFLIQAYELLEERYGDIVDRLRAQEDPAAGALQESIPDVILADNLYGADLSEQAVEITRLALWIRSARTGKTLADLSHNIVWGNSLVDDPQVHDKAMRWQAAFPAVFSRAESGFDCVIGNPPWERLKLQEREFFSFSAPEIANAVSAAKRRELIADLERGNPRLFALYHQAKDAADRALTYARNSGQYPLTGRGDINTYVLFAELARKIVAPHGRVGLLTPSGIATDDTTKEFFSALMESKTLIALYDFENKEPVFPDVHRSFKFCTLLFGGAQTNQQAADFVFFARRMVDLKDKNRHIALSSKDLALLNPNTRTCPIFRSRQDAELTKAIYRRVPILLDESREEGGNPWGVKFVRMFDQTNDAELFQSPAQLQKMGCRLEGNQWVGKDGTYLPLYEAKMIQAYDHRAASVVIAAGNWMRQGQTEATTGVEHQNPEFVAQPRSWVEEAGVLNALKGKRAPSFIGFKDITSPTNERTMIAAAIPWSAVTNHFVLMVTEASTRLETCLLANLNAFILDYAARQKIGGVTLNFFIVNQLPIFPPEHYAQRCPWDRRRTLETWISQRVLKLTYTANDMKPLAEAAGFDPPVHKWNDVERAEMLAELNAAFFLLYGIDRNEVDYILSTFSGMKEGEKLVGMVSQRQLIQAAYDRLGAQISAPA
jgi:hypothetical protein